MSSGGVALADIEQFLAQELAIKSVPDPYTENGLILENATKKATKIALGVTPSLRFLARAAQQGCDAAITHHGLLFGRGVRKVSPILRGRLAQLFAADMAFFSYHLPLDAHPRLGNNALIARALGLKNIEFVGISAVGRGQKDSSFGSLVEDFEAFLGSECVHLFGNPEQAITRVGVCTGAGADELLALAAQGKIDAAFTGEIAERHFHEATELAVPLAAGGHFATERCGIRGLGPLLEERFAGLSAVFIDEDCPI